jgi:hypothetical protein
MKVPFFQKNRQVMEGALSRHGKRPITHVNFEESGIRPEKTGMQGP